jgi:malate dehydrogenase (oxaloacetate-decarboxylating)(NADP+)
VDGEMQADRVGRGAARRMFPNTHAERSANLFVLPNLDAANITYNMVR